MKIMKVIKTGSAIIALSLALAGTAPTVLPMENNFITVEAASKKSRIKLSSTKTYLIKGKTKKLKLSGAKGKIKWTSSKKSIATVNNTGTVRGRKSGTAIITAKYNNRSYKCRVIVEAPKISKTRTTLQKGKTITLKMLNTKQKIKWTSSNKKVATVSSKGTVKGLKSGKATIYATVGSSKYKCYITVQNPKPTTKPPVLQQVEKVSLNHTSLSINVGSTKKLTASVYPTTANNKTISWSSSNSNVARVDQTGTITGMSEGSATITAKSKNGIAATCFITVINPLNNAYKTLQNTILSSNMVNSEGNHFIKFEDYDEGISNSWGIVYEQNTDRFNFILTSTSYNGTKSSLNMYIDARKSNSMNPQIIFLIEDYYSGFKAEAVIPISSYSGQNIKFTITDMIGLTDNSMYDSIQKLCNSELQLGMAGWQILLRSNVGISFSNLGFISYK